MLISACEHRSAFNHCGNSNSKRLNHRVLDCSFALNGSRGTAYRCTELFSLYSFGTSPARAELLVASWMFSSRNVVSGKIQLHAHLHAYIQTAACMPAYTTGIKRLILLCIACASCAAALALVNSACHTAADVPAGLALRMYQVMLHVCAGMFASRSSTCCIKLRVLLRQ
jgi:hypothetical protein